jgi:hypothetical protein
MCPICQQAGFLRCQCESAQPFCDQCNEEGRCISKMDAQCVIYHWDNDPTNPPPPSKLTCLGIANGTSVEKILETIDTYVCNAFNIPFEGQDTPSIHWTPGGPAGHKPKADVQISPDGGNELTLRSNGLYAPSGECKVKVDADDTCDYLENQIEGGTDGIVTNTVVNVAHKLKVVPAIDIAALLAAIINDTTFLTLLCDAVSSCSGGPLPATVTTLDCMDAIITGSYISNEPVTGTIEIPYTGGNGGFYNAISVNSTGVTGLNASAGSGFVAVGNGSIILNVTGTPSSSGAATFAFTLGGQSCNVVINVTEEAGTIGSLDCAGAHGTTSTPTIASGTTLVDYTGGNGGAYSGVVINSTGVTGLTLTLSSGNFNVGSGTLSFALAGTASSDGTASFLINIGGQSCTVNITVINVRASMGAMPGMTMTNVTGITGFTFGAPLNPGQAQDGAYTPFTGVISVTFSGTPIINPSNVALEVNGAVIECINVTAAGTYAFSSHTFNGSDFIHVSGNGGAC